MTTHRAAFLCCLVFALAAAPATSQVVMQWVTVGDPGNANDFADGDSATPGVQNFGAVSYEYRIGKYEVTNDQYAAFLNAAAATDPHGLYHLDMGNHPRGGITRSGVSGSYTYAVRPNMGNKPVNFTDWYDAARMANWMTNGQGSGSTESGVYTLTGTASISAITRDASFPNQVFLPTEDEWYKAAYYQPAQQVGQVDSYWLYPSRSNTVPTFATATATGDVANPGPNVVNYRSGADWNGQNGNVTTVGSTGSPSHYGAYDMGGNVWERNETLINGARGIRGGSWFNLELNLRSSFRNVAGATGDTLGFRLARHAAPPCPGDIADSFGTLGPDGMVDFGDFLALLALVGPCPGMTPGCPGDIADMFGTLNGGDGTVDFGDFLAMLALSGPCP